MRRVMPSLSFAKGVVAVERVILLLLALAVVVIATTVLVLVIR